MHVEPLHVLLSAHDVHIRSLCLPVPLGEVMSSNAHELSKVTKDDGIVIVYVPFNRPFVRPLKAHQGYEFFGADWGRQKPRKSTSSLSSIYSDCFGSSSILPWEKRPLSLTLRQCPESSPSNISQLSTHNPNKSWFSLTPRVLTIPMHQTNKYGASSERRYANRQLPPLTSRQIY